jgi:hypothetical protein
MKLSSLTLPNLAPIHAIDSETNALSSAWPGVGRNSRTGIPVAGKMPANPSRRSLYAMNTRSLSLLVLASLLSGSSSAISQQSAALSVSQPEFVTNRSPTPSENRSNHPLVTEDSSGSPAVAEGVLEPAPDLAQPVISPVHSTIQVNAHLLNLGEHVGESYHSTLPAGTPRCCLEHRSE